MKGARSALWWLSCAVVAVAGPGRVAAQDVAQAAACQRLVGAEGRDSRALLAAEDLRFRAEASGDAAILNCLIADDLVYSHLTGVRQDKAGVIHMLATMHFLGVAASDRAVRIIGDAGFVRGRVVRRLPDGHALGDGYVALYVYRDGRWQLLEWASTAPPP